ncbi:hypothetical protein CCD98_10795, partial [Streptococcus agalactiae]|uniref:AMP-binding protein n=1 Tax=Streptococcus agalactiae TaxID=1311 RepID=UPI000BC6475C
AQTLPDKTALIEADKTLSYGELYQQALIMAQHLALKGVKPVCNEHEKCNSWKVSSGIFAE